MGPRVPSRMGAIQAKRQAPLTKTQISPGASSHSGGYLYSNHVRDLTTRPDLHHSVLPALIRLLNRVLAVRA